MGKEALHGPTCLPYSKRQKGAAPRTSTRPNTVNNRTRSSERPIVHHASFFDQCISGRCGHPNCRWCTPRPAMTSALCLLRRLGFSDVRVVAYKKAESTTSRITECMKTRQAKAETRQDRLASSGAPQFQKWLLFQVNQKTTTQVNQRRVDAGIG